MVEEVKLITFKLQDDEYGIGIDSVQEVRKMRKILFVPNVPAFVEGVIKLRGVVIPVVDLRKRLGLEKKAYEESTRIIVVNLVRRASESSKGVEVEEHVLGVIVDSVQEVLTISEASIDHPDSVLKDAAFLRGVGKAPGRMILIVDIDKVLTLKEKELLNVVPTKVKSTKVRRRKNG